MTAHYFNIADADDESGEASPPQGKTSSGPKLPPDAPDRDAPPPQIFAWLLQALRNDHNPLLVVRRFGYGAEALVELHFRYGLVTARQRELRGTGLRDVFRCFDGTDVPPYSKRQCEQIFSRLVWAAEAKIRDDELDELLDDAAAFLERSLAFGLLRGAYDDRDGYRLICDFHTMNARRRGGEVPLLLLNRATSPAELWVPRPELIDYLRHHRGKLHVPDVRPQLQRLGWRLADLQRRNPGRGGRSPRARVWLVPADWEWCPFDLAQAIEDAREVPFR